MIINIVDTNYSIDVDIGSYYILIEACDSSDNKTQLKINVIVIPSKEYKIYLYSNEVLSLEEILSNLHLPNQNIEVIQNDYINSQNTSGEYKIELKYDLIVDYYVSVIVVVLEGSYNHTNSIIYPLYNRIDKNEIRELVALNLGIKENDLFSVKSDLDVYHEGIYNISAMTYKGEVYNINFIILEMLPQREVTFLEKTYLYFTIFFNLDNRYKTNDVLDFNTRIKYISNIYITSLVRI